VDDAAHLGTRLSGVDQLREPGLEFGDGCQITRFGEFPLAPPPVDLAAEVARRTSEFLQPGGADVDAMKAGEGS